jgi:hypothetical protein
MKISAKWLLAFLGCGALSLLVTFFFGALSISGVTSMVAADTCLWISFAILVLALAAVAIIYCPDMTGSQSALIVFLLAAVAVGGWIGRAKTSNWILEKKAKQSAIEKLPPPAPALDIPKPEISSQRHHTSEVQTGIHIEQHGGGNTANPGVIAGPLGPLAPCTVIQNGGSGNTAAPTCNPDPMAITRTYFCDGTALVKDPRGAVMGTFTQEPGYRNSFNSMALLGRNRDFQGMLNLCTKERKQHSEWPTPILFCAVANANLGNTQLVIDDLKEFESKKQSLMDVSGSLCDKQDSELRSAFPAP